MLKQRPWILITGAMFLLWLGTCAEKPGAKVKPEPHSLQQILAQWRPSEFRLNPEWPYQVWQPDEETEARRLRRDALVALELRLENLPPAQGSKRNMEMVWLQLVWGNFNAAREHLKAYRDNPEKQALVHYVDALCWVMEAKAEANAKALFQALVAIDQALLLKPNWLPAMFNRALILEDLFFHQEAQKAWEELMQREGDVGWRGQAEERHAALAALATGISLRDAAMSLPLSRADRKRLLESNLEDSQGLRDLIQSQILPQWAQAVVNQEPQKADALRVEAQGLANQLAPDETPLLAVMLEQLVQQRTSANVGEILLDLAYGYLALEQGKKALEQFDFAGAEEPLRKAQQIFKRHDHAAAFVAQYHLAEWHFYRQKRNVAKQRFGELLRQLQPDSFPNLRGRIAWMLGLIAQFQGRPLEAAAHFQRALAYFSLSRDAALAGGLHSLLGENERFLGDPNQAYDHLLAARKALMKTQHPRRGFAASMLALRLTEKHHPALLTYVLNEAQFYANGLKHLPSKVYAHILGARAYNGQNQHQRALGEVNRARELISEPLHPQWRSMTAQLDLAEARALLIEDPQHSAALLERAHGVIVENNREALKPELFHLRAQVHSALGQFEKAASDLTAGIETYEKSRPSFANDQRIAGPNPLIGKLYDGLTALHWQRQQPEQAWLVAERLRARFPQAMQIPKSQTSLEAVTAAIPEDTQVLYYVVLEEQLLLWLLDKQQWQALSLPVSQQRLKREVQEFNQQIRRSFAWKGSAERLFRLLVKPALERSPLAKNSVIMADKALHHLPFALLYDSAEGLHMAEKSCLSFAPSMSTFLRARSQDRRKNEPIRTLLVGNPTFDRGRFPRLSDLPGALAETHALANLLEPATFVEGSAATKTRFLQEALRATWIHFGGHAQGGVEAVGFDHMVLAPSQQHPTGALYAREIAALDLSQAQLVSLAACAPSRGDGLLERPNGLVQAFLGAGVTTVLANLWALDDRHATSLLLDFYAKFDAGMAPAEALQAAQIRALKEEKPPRFWAGLQVFGFAGHP